MRQRHLQIERVARQARLERHRREVIAAVGQLLAKGAAPCRKRVEATVRARGTSRIESQNYTTYWNALESAANED